MDDVRRQKKTHENPHQTRSILPNGPWKMYTVSLKMNNVTQGNKAMASEQVHRTFPTNSRQVRRSLKSRQYGG
jgi:hypothetical protein